MAKARAKRCQYCHKPLSMYNDNKYCFAHGMMGKDAALSAANFKLYVDQKAAVARRKKKEEKCKVSSQ